MVHVSEIHAAGGLEKWIRKHSTHSQNTHTDGLSREKMSTTTDCEGCTKKRAQNRNADIPTEHEEQVALVKWAKSWLPEDLRGLLFAIPNGGMRHKKTAVDLKNEGVVKGTPDLFFAWPRLGRHGLFIEMKRVRGGVVSLEQKEMLARLEKAGYAVVVARGCAEAQDAVRRYMFGATWNV